MVAHGGVLLALHHSIPARQLVLRSPLQAVAARIVLNHREVTLCSLYLPPGVELPLQELGRLASELPPPLLLLGDFNAHSTSWGCNDTNTRGRLLERFIDDETLCVLNTGMRTHFTLPSGQTSALDLSIVSPQLAHLFTWSVHEEPLGSDHFPTWLRYQDSPGLGHRPRRWNVSKANWDEFQTFLDVSVSSADDMSVSDYTHALLSSADKTVPKTSGKPRRPPVPWWTKECAEAIRARKRAFRHFHRSSTIENLIVFKKARALARRTIKAAKMASWRTYVSTLNRFTPSHQVWARIKRIAGQFCSVSLPVLHVAGRDVMHPAEVVDAIGCALTERSSGGNTDPHSERYRARCEATAINFATSEALPYNEPFTIHELQSAISSLKSVAEGPDGIHNEMLRHLTQYAQAKLLATFNTLWRQGDFPEAWKDAVVIPILKPGKTGLDPLHYRPISLTSALCKLMEKMVNARLTWFLEAQGFISNMQCGFRKHRSSVDHVLTLDSAIRADWEKSRHVGAVFFDIEAAYDTAWRHGILMKLLNLGIRGSMATFLRNFLSDRFFRVRVGKDISNKYYPANGIPQGGVLSVTLFGIMVNDIGNNIPQSIGLLPRCGESARLP